MHILQINAIYGSRSTGVIVKAIEERLLAEGHRPLAAHPDPVDDPTQELRIGTTLDHKVHALLTRLFGAQGLYSSLATRAFLRRIEKDIPDVVHLHNIHSNYLNYQLLLEFTARHHIPVVMTLHDCWFFTGKCFHFLDVGCEKYQAQCQHCPKRMQDIPSFLVDNSRYVFGLRRELYAKNNIHVVGCSKWITDCARQSPLLAGASFHHIYNGVDLDVFCRGEKGKRPFTILTMANKWFDTANAQARQAVLDILDGEERVLVVGCSREQLQNTHPKTLLCGFVTDRRELAALYGAADVFLNLTLVDTLPTVNMEAAACGTPVVTWDSGGSGELVRQGITGYVVAQQDLDGLVAALKYIKNGIIRPEACRQFAEESFDQEKNYRQYLALYEALCKK